MFAHYQLQNRPQSVKWYKKCRMFLKEELNIEPMETTEQMYKMIMNELIKGYPVQSVIDDSWIVPFL